MAGQEFDWDDLLTLARDLASQNKEAYQRAAVGRAYYYVFHLGRARIIENQFPITMGVDSHKQIWEKFNGSPDYNCKKLGTLALRLKQKRERADYETHYARLGEDLVQVLADANNFFRMLQALDPKLPRNLGVRR